ncbi:MAG TPA: mechanosensitive ion channel family protein [Pseudolabrys sp.]|nr:mechanosensitive ion channel family protein [Pseudolabrys sp.]
MTVTAHLGGELGAFFTAFVAWAAIAVPRVVGAIVLLAIGWWIASRLERATGRMLDRQQRIDPTLRGLISSLVRYSILIIVVVAVLSQLGIQTTSILAALGAAGLAIGLAIQGTLSNIAAGLMLLWLRPFRVGDYIDTGSVAGTVKEVGLFATEMQSWDGVFLFVPNSELWNKKIINYSRLPTRLVDLAFGVDYTDDLDKGEQVLLSLAAEDARVMADPASQVFVDEISDRAIVLRLRFWSLNADYWPVKRELTKKGKAALEAAGLSLPFPQRDLHIKQAPPELISKTAAA